MGHNRWSMLFLFTVAGLHALWNGAIAGRDDGEGGALVVRERGQTEQVALCDFRVAESVGVSKALRIHSRKDKSFKIRTDCTFIILQCSYALQQCILLSASVGWEQRTNRKDGFFLKDSFRTVWAMIDRIPRSPSKESSWRNNLNTARRNTFLKRFFAEKFGQLWTE